MTIQDLVNRIETAKSNLQEARSNLIPPVIPNPVICPQELNSDSERNERVQEGFWNGMANGRVAGFFVGLAGGPKGALIGTSIGGLAGGVIGAQQAGQEYDAKHGEEDDQNQCKQPIA